MSSGGKASSTTGGDEEEEELSAIPTAPLDKIDPLWKSVTGRPVMKGVDEAMRESYASSGDTRCETDGLKELGGCYQPCLLAETCFQVQTQALPVRCQRNRGYCQQLMG